MARNNLFHNIVNDENSFMELLCNLLNLGDIQFNEIFFKFLKITESPKEYKFDTQYRTDKNQNNSRPVLIISSAEEIFFIEIKINNACITKNQPKGYLMELAQMDGYNMKNLYFILPTRDYSHKDELNDKLLKHNKALEIYTTILFWSDFFELCEKEYSLKTNDIISEFFKLIKGWFGYDHIFLPKKEDIKMNVKELGKQLLDFEHVAYTLEKLIESYGFKTNPLRINGKIGFQISTKRNRILGCFEIWNELWAAKGDIFVFIPENVCDFTKEKFKFDGKTYSYISLDSKILNGVLEKIFVECNNKVDKIKQAKAAHWPSFPGRKRRIQSVYAKCQFFINTILFNFISSKSVFIRLRIIFFISVFTVLLEEILIISILQ